MLTLYHYWSSVCSQKARMCLAEKQIAWESRHVDIFRFENYSDWYTKLNPKNVVPTLDVVPHGDELLLVMDYVHGEALLKKLTDCAWTV